MDAGLSAKVMGAEMGKSTRSIQRIENGEVEAKGEDITRWMDICDHDWSIDAAPRT